MTCRRSSVVLLGLVFAVGAIGACKEEEPKPPYSRDGQPTPPLTTGTTEGGTTTEGGVDAGLDLDSGDGGFCSDITLTGTLVDRVGVVGDPPVSIGGVVVDGTYDLTLYSVYVGAGGVGGPTGLTARSTIRIAAGKIEQVLEIGGSAPATTVRSKGAYSAVAATFATTELCPNVGGGSQHQYTAADPQLVLTDQVTKEAFTFVKR